MNTTDHNEHDARERVRLQDERDAAACECAQAVTGGDMTAASEWATEYERICTLLHTLVVDGGGER